MDNISISIIGTRGLKEETKEIQNLLYPTRFTDMRERTMQAIDEIKNETKSSNVTLRSTGAPWAEHIAIDLFLRNKVKSLELYLPHPYELDENKFFDNNIKCNPQKNFGGTLNDYQIGFGRRMQKNTLAEIGQAIRKGAKVTIMPNAIQRNITLANSDAIVALTFGKHNVVQEKTETENIIKDYLKICDTKNQKNTSYHIDLNTGDKHEEIKLSDIKIQRKKTFDPQKPEYKHLFNR